MKRLLIYMVCAGLFTGCSPEDRPLPAAPQAIRFVSGVSVEVTRATGPVSGTVLPQGSRIGLFALSEQSGGGDPQVLMNNLPGMVVAEGAIDYDPVKYYENGRKYAFYACYPYTASSGYTAAAGAPALAVTLDAYAGVQDDYLWASLPEVTPESNAATAVRKFTFRHALCQVRVRIWNGSEATAALQGITLKAPDSGVLSLGDGSWSEIKETEADSFTSFTLFYPSEPVMLPKEAFYEIPASLLQLPVGSETMAKQTFSITIDGKTYNISPSTPAEGWQGGTSYLYTVWYATDGLTFQGTVSDWQPVDGGNIETEE